MFIKNLLLIVVFVMNYLCFYGQTQYAITTTNLNLRENDSKNSKVLSVLSQGDTIEILSEDGSWTKVKKVSLEGYVSSEYLAKIDMKSSLNNDMKNEFKDQIGFVAGFKYVFKHTFLLLFIILAVYTTYKLRRPDARFKTGYREGKVSHFGLLKLALYSALISVLTGFIGGLISIFH
jgi:hypothetical protein